MVYYLLYWSMRNIQSLNIVILNDNEVYTISEQSFMTDLSMMIFYAKLTPQRVKIDSTGSLSE